MTKTNIYTLVLLDAGDKLIEVVREIRIITGLGLREAKDFIEILPRTVTWLVNETEAVELKQRLEQCGATVALGSVGSCD
jgi:large subunit ribosomal protein L7/L12